jgi:hypothetical protein
MAMCEYCGCEVATNRRVPTRLGSLADLCDGCWIQHGRSRPRKRPEPPCDGGSVGFVATVNSSAGVPCSL